MRRWLKTSTSMKSAYLRRLADGGPAKRLASISVTPWLGASVAAICLLGMPTLALASEYRLAFVTDDTTDATSSDITTYNSFVTADAALNLSLPSTTWTAIASTPSINAAANISCGTVCDNNVPIFLVDGTEVATSAAALFAGSILNPIAEDENGNFSSSYVWTGSNADGTAATGNELGASFTMLGFNCCGGTMLALAPDANSDELPLYAISGVLNTVDATPLPAALPLFATGLAALGLLGRRRKRKSAAAAQIAG